MARHTDDKSAGVDLRSASDIQGHRIGIRSFKAQVGCGRYVVLRIQFDIICPMTNAMREAIEVLRDLPEERQEVIARAILDYASHDEGVYHLTDEERREVRAGLAELDRGDMANDEEVRIVHQRMGL